MKFQVIALLLGAACAADEPKSVDQSNAEDKVAKEAIEKAKQELNKFHAELDGTAKKADNYDKMTKE